MIILGIILMIIGFIASIPILWTIGIVLAVVGLILIVLGHLGLPWAGGATTTEVANTFQRPASRTLDA